MLLVIIFQGFRIYGFDHMNAINCGASFSKASLLPSLIKVQRFPYPVLKNLREYIAESLVE